MQKRIGYLQRVTRGRPVLLLPPQGDATAGVVDGWRYTSKDVLHTEDHNPSWRL
ncbi:MAG: hypothetical protein JSV19_03325 [Phycisphaerales bacterium]|nr:MAG: hypothetical protein JSV19_03325 [Phycisphaerales bacterium]